MTAADAGGRQDPLWVVTPYFNPAGYRSRLANFRQFRRHLQAPLLAIELGFGGPPMLGDEDADLVVHCSDGDVMWQKERLINHAVTCLPAACTQVAWIDGDLLFEDGDWALQAGEALAQVPLVQLFGQLRHAPRDADPALLRGAAPGWSQPSLAAGLASGGRAGALLRDSMGRRAGSPSQGMAWAARRTLLETHGLYDRCIVGGGDTALACAALGCPELAVELHRMNTAQRAAYLAWANGLYDAVRGELTGLPGTIHHLWHGDLQHRQGRERHAQLAGHGFDPECDLVHGSDGAWRWARDRTALQSFMRGYFETRREDG